MHCVYAAYLTALRKQHSTPADGLYRRYSLAKLLTHCGHEDVYTYGGVVPFIYRMMAPTKPLIIQHRIVTRAAYMHQADNIMAKVVCGLTNYGEFVERLTLHHAIYLSLSTHHAEYLEYPPIKGGYTMAIQVGERRATNDRRNRNCNYHYHSGYLAV